jgi:hypothetical protein
MPYGAESDRAEPKGPGPLDREASSVESLYDHIQRLSPQSESQRSLQNQTLTMALNLARTRVLLFEQLDLSIPVPLIVAFGVLALSDFRKLRALRAQKRHRHRGLFCPRFGSFQLDISNPGARPLVRGSASDLQRSTTRRIGSARSIRKTQSGRRRTCLSHAVRVTPEQRLLLGLPDKSNKGPRPYRRRAVPSPWLPPRDRSSSRPAITASYSSRSAMAIRIRSTPAPPEVGTPAARRHSTALLRMSAACMENLRPIRTGTFSGFSA